MSLYFPKLSKSLFANSLIIIFEKEFSDYELDFQEMKDITSEEIERVKQEQMEAAMARIALMQSHRGEE